jgi:hypothetical protein
MTTSLEEKTTFQQWSTDTTFILYIFLEQCQDIIIDKELMKSIPIAINLITSQTKDEVDSVHGTDANVFPNWKSDFSFILSRFKEQLNFIDSYELLSIDNISKIKYAISLLAE